MHAIPQLIGSVAALIAVAVVAVCVLSPDPPVTGLSPCVPTADRGTAAGGLRLPLGQGSAGL